MDISVLLATYNRNDILVRTIQSFCELNTDGLEWEVVVVDNANNKETQELVAGFRGKLPIKCLVEEKQGKNHALNKALEIAEGNLFIFTDDDIIANRDWLVEMWAGAGRWADYSIFGGRILPEFPPGRVPINKESRFFNGAYVLADWDIGEGEYSLYKVWGPNMAIRSKVFHNGLKFNGDIGPKGNDYIMGSETELLLRLGEAGLRAIYLPKCLVHHIIRPEQVKEEWLYGRAFRKGRMQAQRSGKEDVPYLFKIPRYLYRQLAEAAMNRLLNLFNPELRMEHAMQHWMIRGVIHQYRLESKGF